MYYVIKSTSSWREFYTQRHLRYLIFLSIWVWHTHTLFVRHLKSLIFGYVDAFVPVYRSVVTKSDDQNGMHKMLSSSFTRDAVIDMKLWHPTLTHKIHSLCHGLHRLHWLFFEIHRSDGAMASITSKIDHISTVSPFVECCDLTISAAWAPTIDLKSVLHCSWSIDYECLGPFSGSRLEIRHIFQKTSWRARFSVLFLTTLRKAFRQISSHDPENGPRHS